MSRIAVFAGVLVIGFSLIFVGCGESADVVLKLSTDSTASYKISSYMRKQVKFERPSEDTISDKVTENSVEIIVDQKVISVDEAGAAIAEMTVKGLKYKQSSPKGVALDFDSSREADASNKLMAVIGKSYKVKLAGDGTASLVDSAAVTSAVAGGMEGKIAKSLFGAKSVGSLHSVVGLSGKDKDGNEIKKTDLKVGSKWVVSEASPKGMMQSKNYEKIYELNEVKDVDGAKVAVVTMETIPGGQQSGGGMFAMFGDKIESDFQDSYSGKMELDLSSGKIVSYDEGLDATWTAIDKSKADAGKEPDILVIAFAKKHSIEEVK